MKKLLFCFGTRPEAIKMAPLIKEAQSQGLGVEVCLTGQHHEMIIPFLKFFNIIPTYELTVMVANQSIAALTSKILTGIEEVIAKSQPSVVVVQGDTTTTFACALAAYFQKIPVAHVEAGLRTTDIYSPFPEEGNRRLVTSIATYFFAPTRKSGENLKKENILKNVFVTGNTSIDALRLTNEKFGSEDNEKVFINKYPMISSGKKTILVTTHRRENHGEPLKNICQALRKISVIPKVQILLPVHLNPNVKNIIENELGRVSSIYLLEPLEYVEFCWLMGKSDIILTDSGGVQEEAPFFKKPVLVLRENTERPEGVCSGVAKLVGANTELIISEVKKLLDNSEYYDSFKKNLNPYGDGFASEKIISILK